MKSKVLRKDFIEWVYDWIKNETEGLDYPSKYAITEEVDTICTALLEDYEDYMTDRISREPGKVFDRKVVIKEFLKQL